MSTDSAADTFRSVIEIQGIAVDDVEETIEVLEACPEVDTVQNDESTLKLRVDALHESRNKSVGSGKVIGVIRGELRQHEIDYQNIREIITGSAESIDGLRENN